MKHILHLFIITIALFSIPMVNLGQAPTLGTAADFCDLFNGW